MPSSSPQTFPSTSSWGSEVKKLHKLRHSLVCVCVCACVWVSYFDLTAKSLCWIVSIQLLTLSLTVVPSSVIWLPMLLSVCSTGSSWASAVQRDGRTKLHATDIHINKHMKTHKHIKEINRICSDRPACATKASISTATARYSLILAPVTLEDTDKLLLFTLHGT